MTRFLKVLGLVTIVVTITVTGCAHYVMDAANYIDITKNAGYSSPNAVKVYVGKLHFKGSSGFGNISAEGNMSPWLKKGVVDALKDVAFVDNPQIADVTIIPIEYDYTHAFVRSTVLLDLNSKRVKLIVVHNNQLRFIDDMSFNAHMLGIADLLGLILKNSITGNRVDLTKVPKEIECIAKSKGGQYLHIENIKTKY
jgi:hypothetical protein